MSKFGARYTIQQTGTQQAGTQQIEGWELFDETVLKEAITNKEESEGKKVLQWLKEVSKFDGFVDDNAWGADDKGDIIFSSKKNASYRIKDDGNIGKINNDIKGELIAKLFAAQNLI